MLGCRLLCAQFASDLDEATQRQLALKQAPGQPYSVVQQVALIYTATRTSVLDGVNDIPAGGFRRQVFVGLGWDSVNATSLTAIEEQMRDDIEAVGKHT